MEVSTLGRPNLEEAHQMRRPILIATYQDFPTRYLLDTGILRRLLERDVPVVVVSPNASSDSFRERFGAKVLALEPNAYAKGHAITRSRRYEFFTRVRWLTLPAGRDIKSIQTHEEIEKLRKNSMGFKGARYLDLEIFTARLLRRSAALRALFFRLESRLVSTDAHQGLFQRHNPAIMITPDVGTIGLTNLLGREAQRHGAKIISVVLSWDNLTSKGLGGIRPDRAVAWNQTMAEELVDYHGMDPAHVFTGGIAHFDDYFLPNPATLERGEFLKSYGLTPDRKTVFLAMASPTMFRKNIECMTELLEAMAANRLSVPTQLLVRLHPAYLTKVRDDGVADLAALDLLKERFRGLLGISVPQSIDQPDGVLLPIDDQKTLANILTHADVMINFYSTLILESAIFDLPTINVAYHPYRQSHFDVGVLAQFTHLSKALRHRSTREAKGKAELIDLVNRYLDNPSLDHDERMRLREYEGGPNKGKAGSAIGDHLYDLWAELTSPR